MDVFDIIQDKYGFVWFGTAKGLIRFDGYEMKAYQENPSDKNSIVNNRIVALAEDRNDRIWLGTAEGLSYFDIRREKFENFLTDPLISTSISSDDIRDLLIDQAGRLWIATDKGIDLFDDQKNEFVHVHKFSEGNETWKGTDINCLEEDSFGRIWVGTERDGLFYFDVKSHEINHLLFSKLASGEIASDRILKISKDGDDQLWFSTGDSRINMIDPVSLQIKSYRADLLPGADFENNNIWDIWPNNDGTLWLGTHSNGLLYFNPETSVFQRYKHNPAITSTIGSNVTTSLWLDDSGVLWIGHRGPGLSRLTTSTSGFDILLNPFEETLIGSYPSFRCLLNDTKGRLWIGTWRNGLACYDLKSGDYQVYLHKENDPSSLAQNMVWDLLEDQNGDIWVGTHKGLQRYDPSGNNFITYGSESGLKTEAVRSLCEDASGRIWIGSFGGLFFKDLGEEKILTSEHIPNFPSSLITELFVDSKNQLWIGINNQGLYRLNLDTQQWTHFQKQRNDPKSLTSNVIWSIAEDAKSKIWIGTEGGGLNLFIPNTDSSEHSFFKHWRSYNSELDENVLNIAIDKQQNLWLTTHKGLLSFNTDSYQTKQYSLPGNIVGLNVEVKAGESGNFYVGNAENIYQFYPDSIWTNRYVPPIYLTDIQVKGQSILMQEKQSNNGKSLIEESTLFTKSLELQYDQNDLTFTFSALNYIHPENNKFRYKLIGYDDKWTKTDALNRSIRYTNLSPKDYTFVIQGSNNEGIWNLEGTSIDLKIYSPWWETKLAMSVWAAILIGIIFGVFRFWTNRRLEAEEKSRILKLDQLKTKFYTDISHEFRTPLTIILGNAELLFETVNDFGKAKANQIQFYGRVLLQKVNNMLDLAKLESEKLTLNLIQGDILKYLEYLVESFQSVASNKSIEVYIKAQERNLMMDFDPERIRQVLSNILSNALKFTPEGGTIHIDFRRVKAGSNSFLRIKVKDSGIGLSKDQIPLIFKRYHQVQKLDSGGDRGTGIGLALVGELVQLMKGKILVNSELGKGTEFMVTLPIHNRAKKDDAFLMDNLPTFENAIVDSMSNGDLNELSQDEAPLILIAEDNPAVREYLVSCLKSLYSIVLAVDGHDALEKVMEHNPELIISDVMMPNKNGFELCQDLKNDEKTSHIPIILLTAKADIESKLSGLKRGADAYLIKPFHREELLVRIKMLLVKQERLRRFYLAKQELTNEPVDPEIVLTLEQAKDFEFLQKTKSYIEIHISDWQLSVDSLIEESDFAAAHFHRKIKAITGMTPLNYLKSIRLKHATTLLKTSNLSIREIANQCCFQDQEYFSKIFKKEFGLTPTEYRNAQILPKT